MIRIAIWGAALFFACTWTIGTYISPRHRMKSTVVSLVYWWAAIAIIAALRLHPAHLIWFMPLTLIHSTCVMGGLLGGGYKVSIASVFIFTGVLAVPALAALIYFGT
jgi:hypothetical protein